MRRFFLIALLLWAAAPSRPCHALERGELLQSLRPSVREDLANYALGPLEDLPGYDLDLTLRDDLGAYSLRETIEYTNQTAAPLSDIALRIFANVGGAAPAPVVLGSARCQEQACQVERPDASVIRLRLSAALPVGARLHIALELQGTLRPIAAADGELLSQGIAGLPSLLGAAQASDYGLLSVSEGTALLAHFYAVLAQRTEQGWQVAPQKPLGDLGAGGLGFVRATVHAPKAVSVVSTGVASVNAASGVHTVRAALVRDFALVASRAIVQRIRQVGDIRVRSHFLPKHTDAGERVLDAAAHALATYEEQFGGYPYSDLDVVEAALQGGAGGCEFSGLVSVASMLYQPLPAAMQQVGPLASMLEFTTAHEVAHQYWYGLVGSDARAHPFEDEALTQWSAVLYFERRYGAERAARELDAQVAMNYRFMRFLGQPDAAADRPVDAFESPLAYSGLIYGKAAFLYPALRKAVGDSVFFNALRSYALRQRFRTADKHALFDVLAELSGRGGKVRSLVQHWLVEKHGDRDLGVTANEAPAQAKGAHDDAQRLQVLLTALAAAAGSPSAAAPGAKPGAGALNAEQLNGLLQNLTSGAGAEAGGGVSAEQLQGLLGGANGNAALQQLLESGTQKQLSDPALEHELSSGSNQQGL